MLCNIFDLFLNNKFHCGELVLGFNFILCVYVYTIVYIYIYIYMCVCVCARACVCVNVVTVSGSSEFTGYHSNELHKRKLCSGSRTGEQYFVSVCHVCSVGIVIFWCEYVKCS
jgi:hypothetical protein